MARRVVDEMPADDVGSVRRQIRAAVIAKIRFKRELARRRLMRLVRLHQQGRRW